MKYMYRPISQGKVLKRLDVAGIRLTETVHSPWLHLPRHCHEFSSLTLVMKGTYVQAFDRTPEWTLAANSIYLEPAGMTHTNRYGETGAHCLILEMTQPWLDSYDRTFSLQPRHLNHQSHAWIVSRMYREFRTGDPYSILAIEGILLELWALLLRQADRFDERPGWLRKVQRRIEEDFRDSITIPMLAGLADVHPATLARCFRKFLGVTPGEYIRRTRLSFAARALRESNQPLSEIALESGFYDQSHFTASFRREYGIPPLRYRRFHRD